MIERLQATIGRLRQSAFAFPLAVVVAALMLGISEMGYHRATSQLKALVTRGQARLEVLHLTGRLSDAESGQRGYLITGHADYLLPYRNASTSALASLARLHSLYEKNGEAVGNTRLDELERQVRTRLSDMDKVLALYDNGQVDEARDVVRSGIGRVAMDRIRSLGTELVEAQNAKVLQGLNYSFDTLLLNRVGVATTTAASLLVLGMYLRQRRQRDKERQQQARLLREERDRLEVQVQHRTAELTELARHLETTREDERARLARDLHDELGALLTAAKLDLARLRPKLTQSAPELLPRIAHLVELLNSGIALKRRIIEDLRPSSLNTLGLQAALQILCKEFSERLGVPLLPRIEAVVLTPSSELTVFRLVQESLNNIAKHAQAGQITLDVRPEGEQVCVRIADDGVGFDTQAVGAARHGLVGMRYRVQAEGGVLSVTSQRGQGTVVQAWLPAGEGAAGAPREPGAPAVPHDAAAADGGPAARP